MKFIADNPFLVTIIGFVVTFLFAAAFLWRPKVGD